MPCSRKCLPFSSLLQDLDYANLRSSGHGLPARSLLLGACGASLNLAEVMHRWNVQSPEALLGRASETLPFWVSLLLVIGIGYYCARLAWLLVPGPAPAALSRNCPARRSRNRTKARIFLNFPLPSSTPLITRSI